MHGKPKAYKHAHGNDNSCHGHHHRRNDERNITEENKQQNKDGQPRQWRRDAHLHKHFKTELVLGYRQSGDIPLLSAIKLIDGRANFFGDSITFVFIQNRHVNGRRFTVL